MKWAQSLDIEPGKIIDSVLGVLKNGVNNIVSSTVSITMGLLTTAMNVSIGFVFACYVLLQKEKLLQQIKKQCTQCSRKNRSDTWHMYGIWQTGFFQLYYRTVYRSCDSWKYVLCIHDNPAFSICNAGGCPDFIYSIDPAVWRNYRMLGSIFLILMISPVKAVLFLGLFLILQQIEGNLIYPHVVGGSVGLPSIWVLVAVTLGGSLMGIAGMLIFIPTVSVIYTLFREWVYARLEKKQLVL